MVFSQNSQSSYLRVNISNIKNPKFERIKNIYIEMLQVHSFRGYCFLNFSPGVYAFTQLHLLQFSTLTYPGIILCLPCYLDACTF